MPSHREPALNSAAATVAILALVVLVGATLTAVTVYRPLAKHGAVQNPVARVLSDSPSSEPVGTVVVDAVPWGRIESISSVDGTRRSVPRPSETPVLLELPPGTWIVALSSPDQAQQHLCEVSVQLGVRGECLAEFGALSVDQYFRDSGWWQ